MSNKSNVTYVSMLEEFLKIMEAEYFKELERRLALHNSIATKGNNETKDSHLNLEGLITRIFMELLYYNIDAGIASTIKTNLLSHFGNILSNLKITEQELNNKLKSEKFKELIHIICMYGEMSIHFVTAKIVDLLLEPNLEK